MERTSIQLRGGLARTLAALALALGLLLPSAPVSAQTAGGPFGLGIILGEPTGVTAKLWLSGDQALDFHAAWNFHDDAFALFVDYLFHLQPWRSPSARVDLPLYVGIGGKIGFRGEGWHPRGDRYRDSDVLLGVRIPVGIAVLFQRAPVEIFLEVAPGLRLIPGTSGTIDAAIGARYYF